MIELDQSTGSVIACILRSMETQVAPYIWSVPEGFKTPSVYFPPEELDTQGFTLEEFRVIHTMYIVFFGDALRQAHRMAARANADIHIMRDRIPVIEEDGAPNGKYLHARDMNVRTIDEDGAAVQLSITWDTHHRYYRPKAKKIMKFYPEIFLKN